MGMLQRVTIFLGAFLLFLVQPMIGNTLLPLFGGTSTVWSVCLATFQILLIGGYFYAHIIRCQSSAKAERNLIIHSGLLFLATVWLFGNVYFKTILPVIASSTPQALGVLASIVTLVAVPYVILSANSTLVQDLTGGQYGLYAISNLGSIVGLWAYPLLFERYLALSGQWMSFAFLCLGYAILFSALIFKSKPTAANAKNNMNAIATKPRYFQFFALSALSCFLLNAVSTHLGSDITPLPLLWVALLSLYLLSYIVGFTDCGSRFARYLSFIFVPLSFYGAWHTGLAEFKYFKTELLLALTLLFLGGMAIHSRLYRIRPDSSHLTIYYLLIAIGGAAGGSICSFAMPFLSNTIAEYPLAIAFAMCVALIDIWEVSGVKLKNNPSKEFNQRIISIGGVSLVIIAAIIGLCRIGKADGTVLKRYRNFYGAGVVAHRTIETSLGKSYEANEFRCNGTTHGLQIGQNNWMRKTPTVYYAEHAGGLALINHPKAKTANPMRVALCGMGIGTLASFAHDGDLYRFYEINPDIARIAQDKSLFTFVPDCNGTAEIVVDDARRALEREAAANEPKYDVLVVDVFTGDAIPPHMATKEAFSLYLDRLEPDGILAFHLSNWHLDLMPMIKAAGHEFGLNVEAYYCASTQYAFESTWAFMSREKLPRMYDERCHTKIDFARVPVVPMMTDEGHSLLPYIQWNLN